MLFGFSNARGVNASPTVISMSPAGFQAKPDSARLSSLYVTSINVARTCAPEATNVTEAALPVQTPLLPSVTRVPSAGASKPLTGFPLTPVNSILVMLPAEHANVVSLFLYKRYSLPLFNKPFVHENVMLLLVKGDSPVSDDASNVTVCFVGSTAVTVTVHSS